MFKLNINNFNEQFKKIYNCKLNIEDSKKKKLWSFMSAMRKKYVILSKKAKFFENLANIQQSFCVL